MRKPRGAVGRVAGQPAESRSVAARKRSICRRVKAASLSALARCVIRPTTSRPARRQLASNPTAPCPYRASGGRAALRGRGRRRRRARAGPRAPRASSSVGPRTRIRGSASDSRRAAPSATVATQSAEAPAPSAAAATSSCTVTVRVGLDHRPQLGTLDRAQQRLDVAPQGSKVDRELGPHHLGYSSSSGTGAPSRSRSIHRAKSGSTSTYPSSPDSTSARAPRFRNASCALALPRSRRASTAVR